LQETVLLWEQLRPKQTTKEQKALLVSTILKKVSNRGTINPAVPAVCFCAAAATLSMCFTVTYCCLPPHHAAGLQYGFAAQPLASIYQRAH
jgi:hypothetical protein